MNSITIRKFITVSVTITVLMTLSALVHQSVFTDFELCNSHQYVKTNANNTTATFSAPYTSEPQSSVRYSMKPIQNGEFSENDYSYSTSEISTSSSFSAYEAYNTKNLKLDDSPENSKKISSESDYSSYSEKFDSESVTEKKVFMGDAPWPFSLLPVFTPSQSSVKKQIAPPNISPVHTPVIIDRRSVNDAGTQHITPYLEIKHNAPEEVTDEVPNQAVNSNPKAQNVTSTIVNLPPEYHVAPRGVAATPQIERKIPVSSPKEELVPPSTNPIAVPVQETSEEELPPTNEPLKKFVSEQEVPPVTEEEKPVIFEENAVSENSVPESSSFPEFTSDPIPESEPETPVTLEDVGNFPLSEPEIAPINKHFGVEKPVILPDIPNKKESPDDLMIIDGVSDLPESPEHPKQPKQPELRDFPPVE